MTVVSSEKHHATFQKNLCTNTMQPLFFVLFHHSTSQTNKKSRNLPSPFFFQPHNLSIFIFLENRFVLTPQKSGLLFCGKIAKPLVCLWSNLPNFYWIRLNLARNAEVLPSLSHFCWIKLLKIQIHWIEL